ncbi:DNA topoisomerase IB [Pelagerythrobacter marinus]|uniref:DNA topoisomerase IB n=1 Tax=Pelagerythrobacter marinus TaxID=538382 RepID=UPI002036EA16|nr:DNA topoisomerase IB [Pelagerythrobacter marinus]USA40114.1 DNA topoisomerase IB [Pelagerythrobacter marinus]WPZ05763.1 DNA topoisomerase IB [Pelagerythrobacter marinus]
MTKLIYVDDDLPGISRRRAGRGWAYYDPQGKLIRDPEERRRLNAIALPPAYRDAWFCPAPNGHILATGIDARGRKQYRYHPEFRAARESEKFDGCLAFGGLLPLVRKRVESDLSGRRLTRERAIASVVRLLDLGAVRIGNEGYARDNRSYGATTLRQRHAEVTGRTLRLRYKAKGGKLREVALTDGSLARVVRRMQDLPGQNVFKYVDDEGDLHTVCSHDVNEYLCDTMGERFTAKNFRTWHASVLAFQILAGAEETLTIKAVLDVVARRLGNTPAVTRRSYVHPAVIDLVERQETWREALRLPRETRWLTREERGLIALLEAAPCAQELLAA